MKSTQLVQIRGVCLQLGKRRLFENLHMELQREHIAVVGRNGVGKSSLLRLIAQELVPQVGAVELFARTRLVDSSAPVDPAGDTLPTEFGSCGEGLLARLQAAVAAEPELLLLDEPSRGLDSDANRWLRATLKNWTGGLVVVSHDSSLLRGFTQFLVVQEAGCWGFSGGFDALVSEMERRDALAAERYRKALQQQAAKEQKRVRDVQRRERKRAGGRVRELKRCPARAMLNSKRGYAQKYQARRRLLQQNRVEAGRDSTSLLQRDMAVHFEVLAAGAAHAAIDVARASEPLLCIENLRVERTGKVLVRQLNLRWGPSERIAVVGPNGSGKSTLLQVMLEERRADSGWVNCARGRIGYIAQHAANFELRESLWQSLCMRYEPAVVAVKLAEQGFPLSLAQRPLCSLSVGERYRAALIDVTESPHIEGLVLDEPTAELDWFGVVGLQRFVKNFAGGLIVASHDGDFLTSLGECVTLRLPELRHL